MFIAQTVSVQNAKDSSQKFENNLTIQMNSTVNLSGILAENID